MRTPVKLTIVLLLLASAACDRDDEPPAEYQGTLWEPYMEWTIVSHAYSGNPFDIESSVVFTHTGSGTTITTGMFYDGNGTWKFRFTPILAGQWTFESYSSIQRLNGYRGIITVDPNPDPGARGFIVPHGRKFARQGPGEDDTEVFIPNTWMNYRGWGDHDQHGWTSISTTFATEQMTGEFLDDAQAHGMNGIHAIIANQWLTMDVASYEEIDDENPDPETFRALERAIVQAHSRGMFIHIWAWGDEARKWTPIGLTGGVNGVTDRRIQRYIAARLGPLPGWVMGMGFDLFSWMETDKAAAWIDYLQEKSGWPMMLGAREDREFITPPNATYYSNDLRPENDFYRQARELLETGNRPLWLTRRFGWMREDVWDMTTTRRALWQFAMAGGAGAIWGHYPPGSEHSGEGDYDRELLTLYHDFWQQHFAEDMESSYDPDTETYILLGQYHAIFYRENAEILEIDLPASAVLPEVFAKDTQNGNRINIPENGPGRQNWQAPYRSDWVIIAGFRQEAEPD
jgi:hypothetical protein